MDIWFSRPEVDGFAGLRAGWRLVIFAAIAGSVPGLLVTAASLAAHNPGARHAATASAMALSPWATLGSETFLFFWMVFATWIMSRLERRPFGYYGLPGRGAFGRQFWSGVLWGVVALSVLLVLIFFSGDFNFGQLVLHGAAIPRFGLEWALSFLAVGFFEEFTFRGYALTTFTQGAGFWTAAAVLSALFGGIHLSNHGEGWIGALSAALLGLFFCFTWKRTGSLWFAVGTHAAWDFCESFVYGVPDSGNISRGRLLKQLFHGSHWITGGSIGPEGSLWVFLILALLFAAFAVLYPARQSAPADEPVRSEL
ncbi:MAG: lysostaphin resistance A-like protein [Terriglobales bacterium]